MTTALLLLLLLATLLPAALCHPSEELKEGKPSWGDEFCRFTYCALMSASKQNQCCSSHGQCCAYVERLAWQDPFAFLDPGKEAKTLAPPVYSPEEIYVGPPKPMRLREETRGSELPILSHTRHNHNHRNHYDHQDQSTPEPRPAIHLLTEGEDLMKTSYNNQMVQNYKSWCVFKFCGLMTPSENKLCCKIYNACCSYSNYHRDMDPFHPDNGRRHP